MGFTISAEFGKNFKPYTFQDIINPFLLYKEDYGKMQEKLEKYAEKLGEIQLPEGEYKIIETNNIAAIKILYPCKKIIKEEITNSSNNTFFLLTRNLFHAYKVPINKMASE